MRLPLTLIAEMTNVVALTLTAPVMADPTDGVPRRTIDIPDITMEEFVFALAAANGGVPCYCDPGVAIKLGIRSLCISPPSSPPVDAQQLGSLCVDIATLRKTYDQGSSDIFYPIVGVLGNSGYLAVMVNVPRSASSSPNNIPFSLMCTNTAHLHAMHTLVLKVTFPNLKAVDTDVTWVSNLMDVLFDNFTIEISGHPFDRAALPLNNILAHVRNLWPMVFNTPTNTAAWTGTIPVMLFPADASSPIPRTAWCDHDAKLWVNGIAPLTSLIVRISNPLESVVKISSALPPIRYGLYAEGVVYNNPEYALHFGLPCESAMDKHAAECTSCDDHKKTCSDKEATNIIEITQKRMTSPFRLAPVRCVQYKTVKLEFDENPWHTQTIPLGDTITKPFNYILIILYRKHPISSVAGQFLIKSATLNVGGDDIVRFDCGDLYEWNWLKMGLRTPPGSACALMPLSRLCDKNGHTMFMNAAVSLKLDLNPDAASVGWSAIISAITKSTMNFGGSAHHQKP